MHMIQIMWHVHDVLVHVCLHVHYSINTTFSFTCYTCLMNVNESPTIKLELQQFPIIYSVYHITLRVHLSLRLCWYSSKAFPATKQGYCGVVSLVVVTIDQCIVRILYKLCEIQIYFLFVIEIYEYLNKKYFKTLLVLHIVARH